MTQAAVAASNASLMTTPVGTAPSYMARAWVNFNGTGTVAIRASGNVSSITDNGTGDYTINFSTAMVDSNFAMVAGGSNVVGTYDRTPVRRLNEAQSASYVRINSSSSLYDFDYAQVSIFR